MSVCAPPRTHYFLFESFLGNFFPAWNVEGEVCSPAAKHFVGEGIEAEGEDGVALGEFEEGLDFFIGLDIEPPDDTCSIVATVRGGGTRRWRRFCRPWRRRRS